MSNSVKGFGSGGAFPWFVQRISGAILLIALLVHFWVLHFFPVGDGSITYENVMARLQHPMWRTFNLIFLVCGLYHGMNGIILNVHDYIRNDHLRTAIVGALWVVALFYLVLGSMTMLGIGKGI